MAGQVTIGKDVLGKLADTVKSTDDMNDAEDNVPHGSSRMITEASPALEGLIDDLNEREREIASLAAKGLDNRDIAHRLHPSKGAVRNRVAPCSTS